MQNITIKNFSDVSEYLYDDYLEYIKRIDIKFINENLEKFLKNIIQNEQIELLKYICDNYNYENISINLVINWLTCYTGKNNPEAILEILLNKIPNLKSYLLSETKCYFKNVAINSSFEFTKQIYKLKKTNNINFNHDKYELIRPDHFVDRRNFYWLVDNKLINCNSNVINLLIGELCSSISNINKENINYLLEKINFNKNELNKIFIENKNYYSVGRDRYLLIDLITNKKYELIYYFFELLKPEEIINKHQTKEIFERLIMRSNYKMFMFIVKHIINLKYDDFLQDISYCNKCIKYCGINTDVRIVYELVKLGAKVDASSKYYDYFNNIQIIKENKN